MQYDIKSRADNPLGRIHVLSESATIPTLPASPLNYSRVRGPRPNADRCTKHGVNNVEFSVWKSETDDSRRITHSRTCID